MRGECRRSATLKGDNIDDMERRSVVEYLENFVRRGRECAYVQQRGYRALRWSYRQVAEAAFRLARELEKRGIGKGERVLLWAPNSAEWVITFFGCALRGVIVVPIDDAGAADFTLRVSQQVDARLMVCSHEHATVVSSSSLPLLILDDLREILAMHSSEPYPAEALASTDTLEIVFTSGTTAEPKGVVISHGNVLANIAPLESEMQRYLKYERLVHPVRFLNLLPLSHVFGQFLGIFLPQLMGGTVIFHHALNPTEVIRVIRRERVSVLVAVPRMLQSLKEKIERDLEEGGLKEGASEDFQRRLRSAEGKPFLRRWWIFRQIHRRFGWKFWAFICGGAALDRITEEFWGRLGYAVIQGYGLTETTSVISVNHPFRLGKGSIGKVLAGREVKLASDGEIMVRGSGVAAGYWTGSDPQPVAGEQGWYGTGDIGELDAAGNLYFKGRKKDVIVTSAGMNIYPEDLEVALRRQPEVKDCAVIALPLDAGEEAWAVLILRDSKTDPELVVRHANQSLAEYQRLRQWFVWLDEDFPRTSTQKPRTNLIQQVVQSRLGGKVSGAISQTPLTELISRVTGRAAGKTSPETDLEADLNLTSLDRVELMGALEDRFQVDLSEAGFAAVNTVKDLENLLHGKTPARGKYHYPVWVQRWPTTWIRVVLQYLLLRPAVFVLGWPRIKGRENLRQIRGPVLVVCNHIDDVDIGFVITALPARLGIKLATATGGEALEAFRTRPAGANFLFSFYYRIKWILGVSLLNLFPLPRQAGFRESFAYAGESVDRGFSILVFPEGHHTTDGKIHPFQAGAGLLANNLAIPIVPMRIDGLFELKKAGKKIARPGQIQIKIGSPVRFPVDSDPRWIASQLQKQIEYL
jgi:long-chain acyl-CoA synthetase